MSDEPYRSMKPKLVKTHGMCILIEEIVAVVKYSTGIRVELRSGQNLSATWTGNEARCTADSTYTMITDALEMFHR